MQGPRAVPNGLHPTDGPSGTKRHSGQARHVEAVYSRAQPVLDGPAQQERTADTVRGPARGRPGASRGPAGGQPRGPAHFLGSGPPEARQGSSGTGYGVDLRSKRSPGDSGEKTELAGCRVRGPYRMDCTRRMGRPERSDIPARRATSRLSTAGRSPYSMALRNKSARLTPSEGQPGGQPGASRGPAGGQPGASRGGQPIFWVPARQRRVRAPLGPGTESTSGPNGRPEIPEKRPNSRAAGSAGRTEWTAPDGWAVRNEATFRPAAGHVEAVYSRAPGASRGGQPIFWVPARQRRVRAPLGPGTESTSGPNGRPEIPEKRPNSRAAGSAGRTEWTAPDGWAVRNEATFRPAAPRRGCLQPGAARTRWPCATRAHG